MLVYEDNGAVRAEPEERGPLVDEDRLLLLLLVIDRFEGEGRHGRAVALVRGFPSAHEVKHDSASDVIYRGGDESGHSCFFVYVV